MNVRYDVCVGLLSKPSLALLLTLLAEVFTNQTRSELANELAYQQAKNTLVAGLFVDTDNGQIIACKLGYECKPNQFYSWLGCVSPAYRGQGIAAELMRQQHDWCRQNGYHTVRTHTYNQWRSMLLLNIRMGFDIVGTVQGKRGLTIVLEKKLV